MYFIEKSEDLVGKIVAFVHAARFAEAITIATTDGGVMVIEQDADEEIRIFKQHQVQRYLFKNHDSGKTLLPKLQELGIIKENEYADLKEAQRLRREESDRQQAIQKEKRERAELIRLKEKYDGVGPEITNEAVLNMLKNSGFTVTERKLPAKDAKELLDRVFIPPEFKAEAKNPEIKCEVSRC